MPDVGLAIHVRKDILLKLLPKKNAFAANGKLSRYDVAPTVK